jgi:hypothetical protein
MDHLKKDCFAWMCLIHINAEASQVQPVSGVSPPEIRDDSSDAGMDNTQIEYILCRRIQKQLPVLLIGGWAPGSLAIVLHSETSTW